MTIYYTARTVFANDYEEDQLGWNGYIAWRGLPHVTEVVSLDSLLNKTLITFNQKNPEDWDHVVIHEKWRTDFYKNHEYVLGRMEPRERFNLLAIVIEPEEDCKNVKIKDFEFVGYDLLDDSYSLSSLTNTDGFLLSYTPADLNQYALLKDFEKAYDVKKRLLKDNPGHGHEDTRVIGVWRSLVIGRGGTLSDQNL